MSPSTNKNSSQTPCRTLLKEEIEDLKHKAGLDNTSKPHPIYFPDDNKSHQGQLLQLIIKQ
jgi:hypothetical protein